MKDQKTLCNHTNVHNSEYGQHWAFCKDCGETVAYYSELQLEKAKNAGYIEIPWNKFQKEPFFQEFKTVKDDVNNPKHYTSDKSGVECIEITRHRNFNIGNAIKYLWRCGLKDSSKHIQDLEKAVWYINDEIKRLKNEI